MLVDGTAYSYRQISSPLLQSADLAQLQHRLLKTVLISEDGVRKLTSVYTHSKLMLS